MATSARSRTPGGPSQEPQTKWFSGAVPSTSSMQASDKTLVLGVGKGGPEGLQGVQTQGDLRPPGKFIETSGGLEREPGVCMLNTFLPHFQCRWPMDPKALPFYKWKIKAQETRGSGSASEAELASGWSIAPFHPILLVHNWPSGANIPGNCVTGREMSACLFQCSRPIVTAGSARHNRRACSAKLQEHGCSRWFWGWDYKSQHLFLLPCENKLVVLLQKKVVRRSSVSKPGGGPGHKPGLPSHPEGVGLEG